jgi:broad specificity phosphatase PhoE
LNTATMSKPSPAGDAAQTIGKFENLFRLSATDTTELILVRHAEPDYRTTNHGNGTPDPALTERGRLQSVRLAQRLRDTKIDAIYTSTMRRALETAAIIAADKELPIISAPKLREIEVSPKVITNGESDDPRKLASQVLVRFLNNPRWDAIEGMESSGDFRQRVLQAINAIISRRAGERVVLVTHAGVINAYLSNVLGIQRDMFFLPEHASITIVRALRDLYAVQSLNDFSHLLPTFSPQ